MITRQKQVHSAKNFQHDDEDHSKEKTVDSMSQKSYSYWKKIRVLKSVSGVTQEK
jgi:hypothetical protein